MEKLLCFLALLSIVHLGLCQLEPVEDADINIDVGKRAAKVACVTNGTKCNASTQACCNDPTFVCGRGKRTGDQFLCLGRGDLSCVGPNSKCNATMGCCEPSTYKCQDGTSLCKKCAKDGQLCADGSPCCSSGSGCTKLSNGTFMCLQPGVTPKMASTTKGPPATLPPASGGQTGGCLGSTITCTSSSQCCGNGAGDHACVTPPVGSKMCLFCAKDGQTCRTVEIPDLIKEVQNEKAAPLVCCNEGSACGVDKDLSAPKCLPKKDIKCVGTAFICGPGTSNACCQSDAECKPSGFPGVSTCQKKH